MDWRRGLRAALILGGVGTILPLVLLLCLTVGGWALGGASEFDRRYDLVWLHDRAPYPMIGVGILFAATGWATFAPRGRQHFVPTLAIVCLASLPSWFLLGSCRLTPPRPKGVEHPLLYLSELLVLAGPPILSSAYLARYRGKSFRDSIISPGFDRAAR